MLLRFKITLYFLLVFFSTFFRKSLFGNLFIFLTYPQHNASPIAMFFAFRGVSKFIDNFSYSFFTSVKNRLLLHGKTRASTIFENFLVFLKMVYAFDPTKFLDQRLLTTIILPYRLYLVRRSNRNYFFPGPIKSIKEYNSLFLRNLSIALRKRSVSFIDQFFMELVYFFSKSEDSFLLKQIEHIIDFGFENRAYLHYRWSLRK
jgi:hypothetical protein